jgi:hypothetical protein
MLTQNFENVHDISVDTSRTETTVSFRDRRGSDVDWKMTYWDAKLLEERLREALGKVST